MSWNLNIRMGKLAALSAPAHAAAPASTPLRPCCSFGKHSSFLSVNRNPRIQTASLQSIRARCLPSPSISAAPAASRWTEKSIRQNSKLCNKERSFGAALPLRQRTVLYLLILAYTFTALQMSFNCLFLVRATCNKIQTACDYGKNNFDHHHL